MPTNCPWTPSHKVKPDPSGAVGQIGTCDRCHLQYKITRTNPYVLVKDEVRSAHVIAALSKRRRLPRAHYKKLLAQLKVKRALRG